MIIKKTKIINGDILADQLKISRDAVYDDGEGNIVVNAEITDADILEAIKNHKIPEVAELTIDQKLANAGITLDELKTALGL